jgi:hypothetical protein
MFCPSAAEIPRPQIGCGRGVQRQGKQFYGAALGAGFFSSLFCFLSLF